MNRFPDKKCRNCGKDCFGTYCRECFLKNKSRRLSCLHPKNETFI